jgi:hypothetical protein
LQGGDEDQHTSGIVHGHVVNVGEPWGGVLNMPARSTCPTTACASTV